MHDFKSHIYYIKQQLVMILVIERNDYKIHISFMIIRKSQLGVSDLFFYQVWVSDLIFNVDFLIKN